MIDIDEFCELWKYLGEWRKTFDRFDVGRTGNITKEQGFKFRLFNSGQVAQ